MLFNTGYAKGLIFVSQKKFPEVNLMTIKVINKARINS